MSVSKLLAQIVDSQVDSSDNRVHDHTCGIKSDPLTQFSVVLSALIHDVDHSGVSNAQLVTENPMLANLYGSRCVAEQNSVDVAWKALMSSAYNDLRAAIFTTEAELRRFRQIIVNTVVATDIFDQDLTLSRQRRWQQAFGEESSPDKKACPAMTNLRAAVATELLIQASDIAHTMQHWHVYQKWNQRLFDEMMTAYRTGRTDKDPSERWHEAELGFFDTYVIPLAQKLKDCGVFGVSGDECLTYALQNRSEWSVKGQRIVQQHVADFEKKQLGKNSTGRATTMLRRGSMRVLRNARQWFGESERSLNTSFASG
jgi:3'5'-cyclic nucleotide phosphodiesterase